MSKSETPEIAACPLAARGAGGAIKDILGGGLLAAIGWGVVRLARPDLAELASPLMLASYATAGAVITRGGRELLDSARQRRRLRPMSGPRGGDDDSRRARADQGEPAAETAAPIWSRIIEELRQHQNQYETTELPGLFVGLHGYWRDALDRRFLIALALAACPLILGFFAGLDRLELSRPGQWLAGFGSIFLPMIVASIVALLAVIVSLFVRFHWDKTLLAWQKTACEQVLDQLTREDAARRNDRRPTSVPSAAPSPAPASFSAPVSAFRLEPAVSSPPPEVVPSGGRGMGMNSSHSGETAAPVAEAWGTAAPGPSVTEAADGWGSFGADAGGVRVKDRRDLNQPDQVAGDAHG